MTLIGTSCPAAIHDTVMACLTANTKTRPTPPRMTARQHFQAQTPYDPSVSIKT
ncbi:hypothetical protein GXY_13308 [Novacetimonas hansenii ATCC 23769]|uniref:Uncharacterized protein n=1 Tax=Novacetimonas hansenii ATCC 23769 TaxID=714995 RepID=D5QHN3_NOVHA|nr:hypothetical protein GXY_13308 [Novacetimonas hansenii ATCC 23769]